jgi:hypothetical protein
MVVKFFINKLHSEMEPFAIICSTSIGFALNTELLLDNNTYFRSLENSSQPALFL